MATALAFQKATKRQSKLRLALAGPAGSGKTYTGLLLAHGLAKGGSVAVIDTERGSASKYSDLWPFDVLELGDHHPERYIEAIHAAEQAGYAVLVIDSLSHAWMGNHGALSLVDDAAKRSQSSNTFGAWRDVTPLHNQLVDAMLASRLHLIATLRSKQDYVQEKDDRGKTVVRKVGMAPIQRDGMEYEFDVFAALDADNTLIVGKTRCSALSGLVVNRPGEDIAERLLAWVEGGEPSAEPPALSVVQTDAERVKAELKARVEELQLLAAASGVALPDVTQCKLVREVKQWIADAEKAIPEAF